ncbi:MAG: NAD-dependent epimerase/dehydratase family protein [Thermodesulfobacteriota bacterium]
MEKVLVTGATGFIGSHLVLANLAKGRAVRAFALPGDPGIAALQAKGVEVVSGDISDFEAVNRAVAGVRLVFHCAAMVTDWAPEELFLKVTVQGTENICRACLAHKVKRLVYLSTNDVFGLSESSVMDEESPLSLWGEPYSDNKILAEQLLRTFVADQRLPASWVYPCWVYGEGDKTFVPLLADAIAKKEMLFWRKGVLVWPTYIENLVELLMIIAEDSRALGQGFLVHDGESTTLQEFCAAIARAIGRKPPTLTLPYGVAYAAAVVLEGIWRAFKIHTRPLLTTYAVKNLGSRLKFSIAKAERVLGWRPKVSHEEGMRRTLAWIKGLEKEELKGK